MLGLALQFAAPGLSPSATAQTSEPSPSPTPTAGSPGQGSERVPILVKFKASATPSDVDAAIRGAGGERARSLTQIRTHVISVPAHARDRILAAYAQLASVERANPAITLSKATTPDDPGTQPRSDLRPDHLHL